MVHAQTCTRCARVSPGDAVYCYYDGAILAAAPGGGRGPVNVGAQAFPTPFVFPTGQRCLNFDQLALTCQNNWEAAVDVLKQGYLESFLGGMGRSDLAGAARDAARFPDRDRGLDQFLGKLPSDVVQPPQLAVEPTELNLGQVKPGEDRQVDLRLENKGMRLVHGSISSGDAVWLAVGASGNASQKLFEFRDSLIVPLRVRGKHVQARNKPQVARLTVDTNAGKIEVMVKMDVPVKPYNGSVFHGARSPRQIAEKAKEKPREAAALFESGAVTRWYKENNWTYPDQGPAAAGLGAVQQYFEALGLTPPPKVEVSERSVNLRGCAGSSLSHTIEVRTQEKRPVYAHGVSDQSWLEVQRAQVTGRTASIQLVVARVPDQPGQTLNANVTIQSNGSQRFVIPVVLAVSEMATGSPFGNNGNGAATTEPASVNPFVTNAAAAAPVVSIARQPPGGVMHFIPAVLLSMALSAVFGYDLLPAGVKDCVGLLPPGEFARQLPMGEGADYDPVPQIAPSFNERQRFGLVVLNEKDPANSAKFKRLTYKEDGSTGNTCVKIDGDEHLYGQAPGDWGREDKAPKRKLVGIETVKGRKWVSAWDFPGNVRVTQTVMIVPNDDTHKLDTALVHYVVENRDSLPHTVGLRIMIDTFIGAEDGVPFAIPGQSDLLTTKRDFNNVKDIPDFIQALERPNLDDPGTKATMILKFPESFRLNSSDPVLDPIVRMVICRWPGNPEIRWDFTKTFFKDMNDKAVGADNDSCVVLYWNERKMPAKTRRAMAFSYGLGKIAPEGDGATGSRMALVYAPKPTAGSEFTIVAWLKDPQNGQVVSLDLPEGMSFVEPRLASQAVVKGKTELAQVSWKVKVARDAKPNVAPGYEVTARSAGARARLTVPVRKAGESFLGGGG